MALVWLIVNDSVGAKRQGSTNTDECDKCLHVMFYPTHRFILTIATVSIGSEPQNFIDATWNDPNHFLALNYQLMLSSSKAIVRKHDMKYVLSCMMIVTSILVAPVSRANTDAAKERLVKHYVESGQVKAKWMDGTFQISVRSMPMSSRLFLMSVCRTAALEYYLNKFSVELRRIDSDKIEAARQCR